MSSEESGAKLLATRKRILEATWQLFEKQPGQGIRMGDIAKAAGISRQALYLHFASRADLLVATTHYVDDVRGLHERNSSWRAATEGVALLETYVEFWGHYIPEIYGLGKALLAIYETDEAAAKAWDDRMTSLKSGCRRTVEALHEQGKLASEWTCDEATDLFWVSLSVRNWEQLTLKCGWSTSQYIERMQHLLKGALVGKVMETS